MCIVTEIVTMKIVEGLGKDDFICIVDNLETNYHAKQPGFIDSELLFHETNDEWIMVQHWETMDHLTTASKKLFKDPTAASFVQSLNPKSVKMIMLPQLRRWE